MVAVGCGSDDDGGVSKTINNTAIGINDNESSSGASRRDSSNNNRKRKKRQTNVHSSRTTPVKEGSGFYSIRTYREEEDSSWDDPDEDRSGEEEDDDGGEGPISTAATAAAAGSKQIVVCRLCGVSYKKQRTAVKKGKKETQHAASCTHRRTRRLLKAQIRRKRRRLGALLRTAEAALARDRNDRRPEYLQDTSTSASSSDNDEDDAQQPVWTEVMAPVHMLQDKVHSYLLHQHLVPDNNEEAEQDAHGMGGIRSFLRGWVRAVSETLRQQNEGAAEHMELSAVGTEVRKLVQKERREMVALKGRIRLAQAVNGELEERIRQQHAEMGRFRSAGRFLDAIDLVRGQVKYTKEHEHSNSNMQPRTHSDEVTIQSKVPSK
jgi:hypothetical protein